MPSIAAAEVAAHARRAGFPTDVIPTMVTIAFAESRFNPRAHNPVPPDNSYGLWQINMLGKMGEERRRQLGLRSNSELFDPATNARAAKMIYDQQGLRAWSTYRGRSTRHTAGVATGPDDVGRLLGGLGGPLGRVGGGAAGDVLGAGPGAAMDAIPALPNPLSELTAPLATVGNAVNAVGSWVGNRRNWVRVSWVLGGGLALLGGMLVWANSAAPRSGAVGIATRLVKG